MTLVSAKVRAAIIYAAYEIIQRESLTEPQTIRFRDSKLGNKRREGVCKQDKKGFEIILSTRISEFVEDKKGNYEDKFGKTFKRMPVELSQKRLLENMAHEVAHLRFWTHSAQHSAYSDHVLMLMNEELKKLGVIA